MQIPHKSLIIPQKDIYFVRHAKEAEGDNGIDNEGVEQAKKTGKYLLQYRTLNIPFDTILASPLPTAAETAKYIENEIKTNNIRFIDELTESILSPENLKPVIKQLHKQDIKNTKDPIEKNRIYDYTDWRQLNVENLKKIGMSVDTPEELKNRTDTIINMLKTEKSDKMIIVSHSKFLAALYKNMFNMDVLPHGKLTDDEKAWVSYVAYDESNDKFRLVSPMDNSHLSLIDL